MVVLLAYACGGTSDSGLGDGSTGLDGSDDLNVADNTVPPSDAGNDVVTATDAETGDASDGGVVDAGPLCNQTPCVVAIAAGGFHNCALVKDGTVRCWGRNNFGQLGVGALADGGFDGTMQPAPVTPAISNVTQITASHYSINSSLTCVLTGGVAKCFGSNSTGQLGLQADAGVFDNAAHPNATAVAGLPSNVASVWAGNLHSCAVDVSGAMWCWGYDTTMQLGRDEGTSNTGVLPAGLVAFDGGAASSVGPGYDFSVAMLASGGAISFGANDVGQLGRTANDPSPPGALTLTGVTNVAAGLEHACAVTAGALECWGNNDNGEIGDGTDDEADAPVTVNVGGKTVSQVSAGYSHTCALASDGTVYCWGQNDQGQCGTGATDAGFDDSDVMTPTQVQGLTGKALEIEAGTNHACALIEGGTVMCWGANDRGQLGQGLIDASVDQNPHPAPVTVKFQ
jgi:alpha-tubulin suppressor-like RCC1 family protein